MSHCWSHSFLDEFEKIAVRLNKEERRRQAIQFGLLGGMAGPVIGAVRNLIQLGKIVPPWTTRPRWLVSQAAAGFGIGGALPIIRHQIERNTQEHARERLRRKRISQTLKRVLPGGET